jgi:hypothetical protein
VVVDDDPAKQGGTLHGVPVQAPAMLAGSDADAVVVTTITASDEIRARLEVPGACALPVYCIAR